MFEFFTKSVISVEGMTAAQFLLCTACALVLGTAVAFVSAYKNNLSKSMILSLVLIPFCVEIIIMMVNRSIGTGLAIAGTFSLVRFRSVPASARDMVSILIALVTGFTIGKGLIWIAVFFCVISCAVLLIAANLKIGGDYSDVKALRITVPESLEYENMFDDIFGEFTSEHVLETAKTSGMGSLYELKYRIVLKKNVSSKQFIDKIRVRNGNLTVSIGNYTLDKRDLL